MKQSNSMPLIQPTAISHGVNEMDGNFETFARKICEYCMKNYVLPWMKKNGVVQSYRAQVISVDSGNGTMTVQKPFDNAVTLPYANGAAGLTAGDQCVVFSLGDATNSIVVSDGMLNL